jgi:tetratricopeptide (TPR) repeat protein
VEAGIALASSLEYLRKHPDSRFKSSIYTIMQNCYGILKDYDKQLDAMIMAYKTTEIDPESPGTNFDNTYWGIANAAEFRAGRLDIAREYYRKLIKEYPTDMRVYGAELALKRIDELENKLLAEIRSETEK